MTETTTPSVEGDRLEAIARLVAPRAWWLRDWIAGSPERVQLNLGRRAAGFPDEDKVVAASLEAARQIAALPCWGGQAVAWLQEWSEDGVAHRLLLSAPPANLWVHGLYKSTVTPLFATPPLPLPGGEEKR